ncbi:MAG: prepilin-type N-terminal cleavage/methylation domain-containing protein [Candidatus Saccharimonadales bacterium]
MNVVRNRAPQQYRGFTIVELLIVIVVIGILATIAVVGYNGVSQRATVALLQSELNGASKRLKIDQVESGAYPATTAAANNGVGLSVTSGITYQYTVDNMVSPQTFCLTATIGTVAYYITNNNSIPISGVCPGHIAPGAPSWQALSLGDNHSCGIVSSKAYCWGRNNLASVSQLGNGNTTNTKIPVPVSTSGVLSGKSVTAIDAGSAHTCVIAGGDPYCWGIGSSGQLGQGASSSSSVPVAVTVSGVLSGKQVTALTAGGNHTCAIASGALYCWGFNSSGQLGDGSTTTRNAPVAVSVAGVLAGKTVTAVSAGTDGTCAIASGALYCWGSAAQGQNGDGTTVDSLLPVAVDTSGALSGKVPTDVARGNYHACAVASGSAYCWGSNTNGALGVGFSPGANPVAVSTAGVLAGKTVQTITTGLYSTCAVADGVAYCWGSSTGDGTTNNAFAPVAVSTATGLAGKTVSLASKGTSHTCLMAGTEIYCWGAAVYGQLGDNATITRLEPSLVTNP